MSESNYAIDTAARFGEIPFTAFTKDLVTGVFDSLVDSHIEQMKEHAEFVQSMSMDLSTYINNTQDGVSFSEITSFLTNYQLPQIQTTDIVSALNQLEKPSATTSPVTNDANPATTDSGKWWQAAIAALGPAINSLVDKIKDSNKTTALTTAAQSLQNYNNAVTTNNAALIQKIPSYKDIQTSIAGLIASNKYALLQTMVKQGMMRLVVTEGEIETKITFSTWNTSESGTENYHSDKADVKRKVVNASNQFSTAGIGFLARRGRFNREVDNTKSRTVTVNTAKSYQRDSSGSKVDIFGRVLIRFKTDFAPLNG